MKYALFATVLLATTFAQHATSLETSANARDVKTVSSEIRINAESAALTAAITKVNKDILAVLKCNKMNKFYKPLDTTADANGCVGAAITTTTTNHKVNLPNVAFNSYPDYSKNKKGFIGSSTRAIDLSDAVEAGAKSISVIGTLAGFTGSCSGVTGTKTLNIANVNTNVATTEATCHYDNSPNRSSFFAWSYSAASKQLTVRAKMAQTNNLMTSAKITGITATYQLTKTVLKIGDGK